SLSLVVILAGPVRAQSSTPYFARTGETQDRPGDAFQKSLKRSLTPPSADGRWGDLPQFGRDLFQPGAGAFTPPETGPVDPDYLLAPGDEITVFVSGFSDTSYALALDREGKIFLPRVGSTFLWGLTFAAAENLIKARIGTVLRNSKIQVSMGRM